MAAMNPSKPIQIFKAGKHVASNGASLFFSESDLAATAAAYDPAKHEAPIVVGHPKHDAPAYGWVKSLAFADGLDAEPHQVEPAFAEMWAAGRFKKVSASFYTPDSPQNPVPGVYYLRHVGCLGAQPPAIKGLRSHEFKEAETGIVEFADYDDVVNASLWRQFREWLIGFQGIAVADNVAPSYQVAALEQAAQQEDDEDSSTSALPTSSFNEHKPKGDEMSDAEKARLAALETENAKLKTDNTALFAENEKLKKDAVAFAEAAATAKKVTRHAEHVAFAEGLIKAGRLLPARKDQTVSFMDNLADQDSLVEFGEGADKKSFTQLAIYKEQLEASPVLVEFKEVAGGILVGEDKEMDASALAKAAQEFQFSEAAAGRVVNTAQAVTHVMSKAAA